MFTKFNYDLESLSEWLRVNKLSLNIGKTNYVVFKQNHTAVDAHLTINVENVLIEYKTVVTFLGAYIDEKLEWHAHIQYIINKLSK